jgi:hypothetical protein
MEDGFEMGLAILANLAILADLAILANSENLVLEKPKYWSEKLSLLRSSDHLTSKNPLCFSC